jgi:hypothetical protein
MLGCGLSGYQKQRKSMCVKSLRQSRGPSEDADYVGHGEVAVVFHVNRLYLDG